jgi:uncharacterized protein (DUF302 family)
MEPENVWHVQPIPLPVEKTLKSLRRTLQAAEIDVVQQLDLSREFQGQLAADKSRCILLLVDCPLLLFEAVALDRAAAVFFPLHVVVTGDDAGASIHWAHPAAAANSRLPATVRRPVDALHARLTQLLGHPKDWLGLPR